MLYQMDLSGNPPADICSTYWQENPCDDETRAFAGRLFEGAAGDLENIDGIIARHSENWKISRMPTVDKNLLRLAIHELRSMGDIPAKVTLNEAIEIAKKYGTVESGAFINGVLDKIAKELGKE